MTLRGNAAEKKLDILFVGGLPPFRAGSAISLSQLLIEFARGGHTVRAVTPVTPDSRQAGEVFAATTPALDLTWLEVPHFDYATEVPASDEYRALEREQVQKVVPPLIADRRPDVVITGHEVWAWHIPELARSYSLPSVLFIRGNPTRGILGGTYPEGPARELLEQFRKVDLMITVAEHYAEGLRRLGFGNVKAIPNAIDVHRFNPVPKDPRLLESLHIAPDDVVIGFVANLKAIKRPLDLVESAGIALRDRPDLLYLVVGDGLLRGAMEDACREKGIYDRFRFVGWVDYERVPANINLADVVVVPSEGEGMARVYLEAQACARVLLASDIPAAREVLVHGQTGLLFRKGDVQDLADTTLFAARNPGLRAEIGRSGRQSVDQTHSLERAVSTYLASLQDVVQRRRG